MGKRNTREEKRYICDYPELMQEWDFDKNDGLDPKMIRHRTKIRVWWKCEKGHEWQALVGNRTHGSRCPICSVLPRTKERIAQKIATSGSLAVCNPRLAAEWHPIRNGELLPDAITASSNKKVWWQCEKGHEWQAVVANRNNNGSGCPYCNGRKAITGINDLVTVAPQLAAQWHPTLNGNLHPEDVKAGSNKKVWWRCLNGHEWQAEIKGRSRGNGCPLCARMGNKKAPADGS